MKRCYCLILMALTMTVTLKAQDRHQGKFSPEQFEAELHDCIVREAHLTSQEADKFFPVYKEMQQKQRMIFDRQREQAKVKPQNDEGCMKAIISHDEMDMELKRIQYAYHKKFMELLPPSKVFDILKAENRFHRKAMKNWGKGGYDGKPLPRHNHK